MYSGEMKYHEMRDFVEQYAEVLSSKNKIKERRGQEVSEHIRSGFLIMG
jgi:hypothetical protein